MALLGFRTIDEMVGPRGHGSIVRPAVAHWKAGGLDLSHASRRAGSAHVAYGAGVSGRRTTGSTRRSTTSSSRRAEPALAARKRVDLRFPIRNVNRTVGTMLGAELTRRFGSLGLPDDTIHIRFTGSAGQSFGAFVPHGMTMQLEGDANDYFGKGLSGGKLLIFPPEEATFVARRQRHHRQRRALRRDERRGVRPRPGRRAVRRAQQRRRGGRRGRGRPRLRVHDGRRVVVVLGRTGRNFAAGMSGGIAYVFDPSRQFRPRCNHALVDLETRDERRGHRARPRSDRAAHPVHRQRPRRARSWTTGGRPAKQFVKVMPRDYKRVLDGRGARAGRGSRAGVRRARRGGPWVRSPAFSRSIGPSRRRGRFRERIRDWQEVYLPVGEQDMRSQGARCMDCSIPFCHQGCPLGNLIPDWNDLVYKNRWREAIDRLHATNNFPEWTGRLCPAPCEASCVLGINDDAVTIKSIEQSIVDRAFDEGWIVAGAAREPNGQARRRRRIGSCRAGRGAAAQPRRARRDRVRARRSDRRAAAVRHSRVQDGEAVPRPPARRCSRRRASRSGRASTSA